MDKNYMLQAIEEAKRGFRQTYQSTVGAVIVKDNPCDCSWCTPAK